jgi:hypothetical protein
VSTFQSEVPEPQAGPGGSTEPETLHYPSQLVTLTDDGFWDAYGDFAGAARRLAELDPVTDEMVRIQNASVQSCHY